MSDVKVENKVTMTRQEAARWLADVAQALSADGKAKFRLAGSTVELEVPDEVRCEAELEVDGDEIELEFEMKWSTAHAPAPAKRRVAAASK